MLIDRLLSPIVLFVFEKLCSMISIKLPILRIRLHFVQDLFFFQILNNKILISTLFDNGLSILAYLFYLKRHVMIKKT